MEIVCVGQRPDTQMKSPWAPWYIVCQYSEPLEFMNKPYASWAGTGCRYPSTCITPLAHVFTYTTYRIAPDEQNGFPTSWLTFTL